MDDFLKKRKVKNWQCVRMDNSQVKKYQCPLTVRENAQPVHSN